MFSISNEIAYERLMVQAVAQSPSAIAEGLSCWLPQSCWVDVGSRAEKWSRQESEAVVQLLQRLGDRGIREPDLYIISPFRDVADRLRRHVVKHPDLNELGVLGRKPEEWGRAHVGTVHTFQGKEAEAVFLVLGASADARRGSRDWAGSTPNILNVAATRARKALYVIGRHDAWSAAGVFSTASGLLPVVRWPFEVAGMTGLERGVAQGTAARHRGGPEEMRP